MCQLRRLPMFPLFPVLPLGLLLANAILACVVLGKVRRLEARMT
jgi:hypothetical protein